MSIGIAILGAGRIGKVHAEAISSIKGARLVAIAEPVTEIAKKIRKQYNCKIFSADEIAGTKEIDAVVICTPTDTHADLIEKFVQGDKAVFCEKPIDLNTNRVRACLKVVRCFHGKLMIGFQRRFDPDFLALKRAIDEGRIGKIEMMTLISRDPAPPPYEYIERSGGIFRDMTIHDIDVARWILDEEVIKVQAAASVLTDPKIGQLGDYDSANLILTTTNGKQCTITNSRRATYGYDQRIEVHGSLGLVAAQNQKEAFIEVADSKGFHKPVLKNFFMSRYFEAYKNEIHAFINALLEGEPMPTTGEDGLRALEIAEAAMISVQTGKAVEC